LNDMAEFKNNSTADQRYRRNQKDCPPAVNLRQSILEMHRIYGSMGEDQFVAWYSRRYKVDPNTIRKVLDKSKEG